MVSAFQDKTAGVRSVSTRQPLAILQVHHNFVPCAAVNSRDIAIGSWDKTLRLYANAADFPFTFVRWGLHTDCIQTAKFIGLDSILSG